MTIEVNENLQALWFVQLDERTDWMGGLSREGDHYKMLYRVRHYAEKPGEKLEAWNPRDVKNWYEAKIKDPSPAEVVVAKMRAAVLAMAESIGSSADEILCIGKTPEQVISEMNRKPYMHHMHVPAASEMN